MVIIVGLGNPGEKFKNTRHNVGFMAIDKIADNFQFTIFNFQSIFNAEISKGEISGKKIILVKPRTFMNDSGSAVKKIIGNWKLEIGNYIVVVHDDADLPVGKIKIVKDRGSAGHKGVESIIKNIGNENLIRIRIGIAPQGKTDRARDSINSIKAKKIVLKNFAKEEKEILNRTIEKVAQVINFLIKNGLDKAMNEYNK